jgi:hypothetical protein
MKNTITLSLFLILCWHQSFCQSLSVIKDGRTLKNELAKNKYEIDSNAKAVILYEEGTVIFEYSSYSYKYEVVAKILSDDAISDLAEVTISKRENTEITDITAETYNLASNGDVEKSKLERDNILKDKINDKLNVLKFNIPNVKKGSIIHYIYKVHKSETANIPEWSFQNIYPTLYSRFSLQLPYSFSFNKIIRSSKMFVQVHKAKELETCDACEFAEGNDISGNYTAWATKNVPAYISEPFSSSKDNFLERIKVIITKYYTSQGEQKKLFNTWEDFSKIYLYGNDDYVGQVFKSNGFLNETVAAVTKNSKTDLEKAHAIYNYVRSNFSYADNDDENIKSVFKNKKGDVFGINMLLVAMMKSADLNCEPIVSTTKSHERLTSLYPSPFSLNYLLAVFKDQGRDYFLDATEENVPFGFLQPICYNGYARLVNKTTGAAVVLSPDDIKDKTTIIVNIEPSADNSNLVIKLDEKLGVFRSIKLRDASKRDSADAAKTIIEAFTGSSISVNSGSIRLKNFQNPDDQITIHLEAKLNLDPKISLLYFNPFLEKFYDKNPFTAAERSLPVEMDYKEDLTYILNFKVPEGYTLDDYPKSISVKLGPEGDMLFSNTLNYNPEIRTFGLLSRYTSATTTFPSSEYKNIREMFEKMIEEQNKKVVFKKG